MSLSSSKWWVEDLTDVCVQFQLDLSCLVDGELDEVAAGRAIGHLEGCSVCREFFEDTRNQVRAHRDLGDPEAIAARYSTLLGRSLLVLGTDMVFNRLYMSFEHANKVFQRVHESVIGVWDFDGSSIEYTFFVCLDNLVTRGDVIDGCRYDFCGDGKLSGDFDTSIARWKKVDRGR